VEKWRENEVEMAGDHIWDGYEQFGVGHEIG
jgi:hypothetical protein